MLVELINRQWKAIKLAGLWSLVIKESTISVETLAQAIYFTEYFGKHYRLFMETLRLQPYERFVRAMKENEVKNEVTVDFLIKGEYIDVGKRQLDSVLKNFISTVNSKLNGSAVLKLTADKSKITITTIEKANLTTKHIISVKVFNEPITKDEMKTQSAVNFSLAAADLPTIKNFLKTKRAAYIPFQLKKGHRKDVNIESETSLLVLDVDKSEISMESLHNDFLKKLNHILASTSDRTNKFKFRLLIPINKKLGKDKAVYSKVVRKVAEELMLDIDPVSAVRSTVFFSYGDSEVFITDDQEIFDVNPILADLEIEPVKSKLTPKEKKDLKDEITYDLEGVFAGALDAPYGRMHLAFYAAGKKMIQAGLTKEEVEVTYLTMNDLLDDPFDEVRLYSTLIQQIQNKL
jgi:hypothetical protein